MSLSKTTKTIKPISNPVNSRLNGMQYELTGNSRINQRDLANKSYKQSVSSHSTIYTLSLLVVKHKTALLVSGNIVLVLNFVLPEWPQMVLGLLGR